MPVLIHFRAAAEFDPAQFAAKSFFIREHLPGVGNNVRRKSGLFLQFFQSAWDQRQAHRIQGEHEETPTFNSFWCIDWFKRSEPQSGCLKARAKLGNPMPACLIRETRNDIDIGFHNRRSRGRRDFFGRADK